MEKIYCENCKFFKHLSSIYNTHIVRQCNHPSNIEVCDHAIYKKSEPKFSCHTLNSSNNCKNYSRKWWKFWVKK